MAKNAQEKKIDKGGLFIPTGIFLGLAYGFATQDVVVGLFGGLGLGFLAMAITAVIKK